MRLGPKVYLVKPVLDDFQVLDVDSSDIDDLFVLRLDGTRIRDDEWRSPPLYVPKVNLPEPDIWGVRTSTCFAFDAAVADQLQCVIAMSGQLLPLNVPGRDDLSILNVTEVIDCLDAKQSYPSGLPDVIEKYVFIPHRLPDASLFKIPESSHVELFCIQRTDPDEPGFKDFYDSNGWQGLDFDLVWGEDVGPIGGRMRVRF